MVIPLDCNEAWDFSRGLAWVHQPGEAVKVDLSDFAPALEKLPPGRYKARVRFWQDPDKSRKTSFLSPAAEFVVRE